MPMEEPTDHPQFFQVIVQPNQFHQMSVPKKFVSDYGDLLSSGRSYLRIHASTVRWGVQLIKRDGEVHFRSGWLEFCRRFSLALGNFVVFEYLGNNNFDVVIFNTSGIEIDYRRRYLDRIEEVDNSTDLSSDSLLQPYVNQGTTDDDIEPLQALGEKKKRWSFPEPENEEGAPITVGKSRRGRPTVRLNKPGKGIPKAIGDSMSFPTAVKDLVFPKTFNIKMLPSYVAKNCTVNVPVKHARAFLVNGNNATERRFIKLTIKNPTGGPVHSRKDLPPTWSVHYYVDKRGYTLLSRGWYEFVVDNSIEERDECLFELIDLECKMYIVSILRWKKDKDWIKEKDQCAAAAAANKVKQRSRPDPAPATVNRAPVSCSNASRGRLRRKRSRNKQCQISVG